MEIERCRDVQEIFESDQVPQRCHRVVQYHIHPMSMHRLNSLAPYVDRGEVRVKKSQIEGAEAIRAPEEVNHRTAGKVDPFDTHPSQVIERVHEPLNITSMSQLGSRQIMFSSCAVGVVISRVAVDETVKHHCVEWGALIIR